MKLQEPAFSREKLLTFLRTNCVLARQQKTLFFVCSTDGFRGILIMVSVAEFCVWFHERFYAETTAV